MMYLNLKSVEIKSVRFLYFACFSCKDILKTKQNQASIIKPYPIHLENYNKTSYFNKVNVCE